MTPVRATMLLRLIGRPEDLDAALAHPGRWEVGGHHRKPSRHDDGQQLLYAQITVPTAAPPPPGQLVDDQLVDDVAQAIRDANTPQGWNPDAPQLLPAGHLAEAALAHLAARGRLLPDGGHTTQSWRVVYTPAGSGPASTGHTDAYAQALAAYATAVQCGFTAVLQTRTTRTFRDGSMFTGPWQPEDIP